MTGEPIKLLEPYKGLQPYEEENREIFFGRAEERDIIIDKLLANKLTLLFAASGVGKSSLLRAAVIPGLKQPDQGNPAVVYYNDWVPDPIGHLKDETLLALETQGKLRDIHTLNKDIPLHQFFHVCSAVTGSRLVVILDQFEEFFQYHRYKKEFAQWIEQLSQCFKDKANSPVFVISMREDYALELNFFKQYLPTTLFANFFRLEKLEKKRAEEAVRFPVERLGFHYENKLLEELLEDLTRREKEGRLGDSPLTLVKDAPAYVDPPYLQIVCTGLWNREKTNPDKIIRFSVYRDNNRAEGFVESYFKKVMVNLSPRQKKIASRAFDHLVTPRGTKIAYTLEALNHHLKIGEDKLEDVLEKLRESRILRSKKREDAVWYELYHDVFSKIIFQWNEKFKKSQRTRHVKFITAVSVIVVLAMLINYFFLLSGGYLLHSHGKMEGRVELYKLSGISGIKTFTAETIFRQEQFLKQNRFDNNKIAGYQDLGNKLIPLLPIKESIPAYFAAGDFEMAFTAVESFVRENPGDGEYPINILASFDSPQREQWLEKLTGEGLEDIVRIYAAEALVRLGKKEKIHFLINLIRENFDKKDRSMEKNQGQYQRPDLSQPGDQKVDQGKRIKVITHSIEALGRLGSKEAVRPLYDALRYKVAQVRSSAAAALGKIGSKDAVGILINVVKDQKDADLVREAADALRGMDREEAVEPLINALKDEDDYIRSSVVSGLGEIGSEKAIRPLIHVLENQDEDAKVRISALKALGPLGKEEAVGPLIDALKDKNDKMRETAAEILGRLGKEEAVGPLIDALENDADYTVRGFTASALGKIGSENAVEPLIAALKDKNELAADVRRNAAEALGEIGSENAVGPLIDALKDKDALMRNKVVCALGNIGSEKAIRPLRDMLKDEDAAVRISAAWILGIFGSEEAVVHFTIVLKNRDSDLRREAAEALSKIGSEKALQPLIDALKDEDASVRIYAADGLGNIGRKEAVGPLIDTLKDMEYRVRAYAAEALGHIGSEKALGPLIDALKDEESFVRRYASGALGEIGSEQAVGPLIDALNDKDAYVRSAAAKALGHIGSEKAVGPLIHALKDSDKWVRDAAAVALGCTGSEYAVGPLIDTLESGNLNLRSYAVSALGDIGSEKAAGPLIHVLNDKDEDPRVRSKAAEALEKFGKEHVEGPLIDALIDPSPEVRRSAAFTLGRIGIPEARIPLSNLLDDRDPDVRANAVIGLARLEATEFADKIRIMFENEKVEKVRSAAAAALTKFGDIEAREYLKTQLEKDDFYHPFIATTAIAFAPSENGIPLLSEMPKKENLRLQWEVISELEDLKEESVLPYLLTLSSLPRVSIQEASVKALGNLNSRDSIEELKKILGDTNRRISLRLKAISCLGNILESREAIEVFTNFLNNDNESIRFKALIQLGKIKTFPREQAQSLEERLKEELHTLVKNKAKWRDTSDNQERQETQKKYEPGEAMEFQLAFVISRIDTEFGVQQLSHELANVRQGAWMALGELQEVSLIKRLSQMIRKDDRPWFRHAAFRAVDYILTNIEVSGGEAELEELRDFLKLLQAKEREYPLEEPSDMEKEIDKIIDAIRNRTQWTIRQLEKRMEKPGRISDNLWNLLSKRWAMLHGSPALLHNSCAIPHRSSALPHNNCALLHRISTLPHNSRAVLHGNSALLHNSCAVLHGSSALSHNSCARLHNG